MSWGNSTCHRNRGTIQVTVSTSDMSTLGGIACAKELLRPMWVEELMHHHCRLMPAAAQIPPLPRRTQTWACTQGQPKKEQKKPQTTRPQRSCNWNVSFQGNVFSPIFPAGPPQLLVHLFSINQLSSKGKANAWYYFRTFLQLTKYDKFMIGHEINENKLQKNVGVNRSQ